VSATTSKPRTETTSLIHLMKTKDSLLAAAIDRSLDPFSTDRLASETPDRAAFHQRDGHLARSNNRAAQCDNEYADFNHG